jgi:hypothetical protein
MNWDSLTIAYQGEREKAANAANAEDAAMWRWVCALVEDGRLRWRQTERGWIVSLDYRHLATQQDFYEAIREARIRKNASEQPEPQDAR